MFSPDIRVWTLREQLDLVKRGYELRKARRLPILLVESGEVYVAESEIDPWGTRRHLSWAAFETLILEAEYKAALERKPIESASSPVVFSLARGA